MAFTVQTIFCAGSLEAAQGPGLFFSPVCQLTRAVPSGVWVDSIQGTIPWRFELSTRSPTPPIESQAACHLDIGA
jgi:hypothetical protein